MHGIFNSLCDNFLKANISFKNIIIVPFLIIIITFMIILIYQFPVSAYEEVIDFDGDFTSTIINCSRIMWYQDASEGHNSSPALRSGPIRNSGVSCFGKYVEGPASIEFYWKLDQYARIGDLSFKVDNDTIVLCTSSAWTPISYAIAPGTHSLSWEYRKQYSYPEFVGTGWIDDLVIVSDKARLEEISTGFVVNNSTISHDRDLNLFDIKLSIIEKALSDLNESFSATIASASQGLIVSDNLSWIRDRVIFVSDEKSNLTDIILKNKNKIIILDDGVYNTNGLWITSGDIYLRSLRKWGAKLDAQNNSKGIVIDTANNVTIDSLVVSNCTDGIHIQNSSHCNIINNLIVDFDRIGITLINSNQSTVMLNSLIPNRVAKVVGIQMLSSFNNTFALNEIGIGLSNSDSYLFESQFSKENTIYISDSGRIWEDNLPNNISDEFYCEIWDSSFDCWLCNTDRSINLSGSENIWLHP